MKKLIAWSLIIGLAPSFAFATGNHPMAGCGLGYLLLSHQDNQKVTQILGATTNGTFGSQTFGISSGTSGCTEDGAVKLAKQTEVYAEVNLDSLRQNMAAGQGEYADAFAALLGASPAARPAMVSFFHANYSVLFPSANTTSTDMLHTLAGLLAQRPDLLG